MKYRFTETSARHLAALNDLRDEVQPNLILSSPAAQDEWAKLVRRLPSLDETSMGFIGLSEGHLDELLSKARRFRDILRDWRQLAIAVPIDDGVEPERIQPRSD